MKQTRVMLALLLAVAALTGAQAQTGQTQWDELNRRGYPQWFSDAKLGIFVHWGLYSVPAYAGKEGYGEWLYKGLMARDPGRMRAMSWYADTTLPVREMYGRLADHWHAELWHPDDWARMFREAGARYVMLVTKHHDGYSLWDDPYQPEWNSVVSGPRRNIVGELTEAVRKEGLRMCFYYSLPEWSHPLHRWTVDPDTAIGRYVESYMMPQFKSLVSRYHPDAIFADGDWDFTAEQLHSTELIAWYYRTVGDKAIVNDRWGHGTQHGFRTPEYSAGIADTTRPWAECRGLGRSFGLNRNEDLDNYLTDRELIQHFCELVAHGGGLTLNVGPYADGTIPLIQQERLRALGRWLQVNGEAIYGSRPCAVPCQREHMSATLPADTCIDYDWVRNAPLKEMPVDHFAVRWEGCFVAPTEGDYTFRAVGDDEMTVLHDGDTLVQHRHAWAENNDTHTVHLREGERYALHVLYRENDLEAVARLTVSHDGGAFVPAPLADLHGTATWEHAFRCFTQREGNLYVIEFERPGTTLVIPADALPLAGGQRLKKGTIVTLLGTTGTVKWKQLRDGAVRLDLSAIPQSELNALDHAWVFKITR